MPAAGSVRFAAAGPRPTMILTSLSIHIPYYTDALPFQQGLYQDD